MLSRFPAIEPYQVHQLGVEPPHTLYIEESGNPQGMPVLFVHGGPGSGCKPEHRQFFDPQRYRIILFDQRGCGHSKPHACLETNTTPALIADMEAIRIYLGVERWVLFGGSWGATLSLLYAQAYPEQVAALILRGTFLARPSDIAWFYQQGANTIYPDYWEDFVRPIPETERQDLINAYYRRLTGDDDIARMAAARAWSLWETRCVALENNVNTTEFFHEQHMALSLARIECHYFVNHAFLTPNQILDNIEKIQHIPGIIVHGRYDMICPFENAWTLHKAWPLSDLFIIRNAGHSSSEPGILDALIYATNKIVMAS